MTEKYDYPPAPPREQAARREWDTWQAWRGYSASQQNPWPLPRIEVHYATTRDHALPSALQRPVMGEKAGPLVSHQPVKLADFDAGASNVPAHVQMIARAAEFALWRFRELGFRRPALGPHGEQGNTLKINLVRTRDYRGMTSPDWDFIEISNQIREETALLTVGHEIFHRIQYAYNPTRREMRVCELDEPDLWTLVFEGGARFSEDLLVDGTNRYEYDGERWFTERRRPLFRTADFDGALAGAVYEASLFWKYVAEQHAAPSRERNSESQRPGAPSLEPRGWRPAPENMREAETQIRLLEAIELCRKEGLAAEEQRERITVDNLRTARATMFGIGTFDKPVLVGKEQAPSDGVAPRRLVDLTTTALRALGMGRISSPGDAPLCGETTWGNFVVALALNGFSESDLRFRFLETPAFRTVAGSPLQVAANRTVPYEMLPEIGPGSVPSSGGGGGRGGRSDEP
ncbi:hypothetical protein [Elioraea sp.]|uniref:hypothetical protein n=1 Tax=Elioraea sp. TaxID=2185103 RepID=UPI0025C1B616|nr:hypothetical protein [Elioraea sp.]